MGFSRQEYWSGSPFPSLGDLPNPGIEPRSPELQADALTSEPPGKALFKYSFKYFLQLPYKVTTNYNKLYSKRFSYISAFNPHNHTVRKK